MALNGNSLAVNDPQTLTPRDKAANGPFLYAMSEKGQGTKGILTNKEAIALDQDSLGAQGQRIKGKGALEVAAHDAVLIRAKRPNASAILTAAPATRASLQGDARSRFF